jgi:photosystem II stability/assembly factor-like uncharacterized protein
MFFSFALHRTAFRSAVVVLSGAALAAAVVAVPAASQPRNAPTWTSVGPSSVTGWSGKINAFAYQVANPKVMYTAGGWGNTPRESPSQAGIYRTTDGGAHWSAIDKGLTNPDGTISSTVNGLWLDQTHPTIVLASTEFGGTFRSTDGGDNWTNVDRNEATQFALVGTSLYLATRLGVSVSTDDGATWRVSLPVASGATSVVTAGGATFAGSTAGDVYGLAGGAWTKLGHPGLGAIHDLAVDPFKPATVYANVDDKFAWNQDLYASLDGAKTWARVRGRWSLGAQAIAFSLVVPNRIYLGDDGSGTIFHFAADGSHEAKLQSGVELGGVDMRYIIPVPGQDKTDDACYALMDQGLFFAAHCSSGVAPSLDKNTRKSLAYDIAPGGNGVNLLVPLQDMGTGLSTNDGQTWAQLNNTGEGAEAALNPFDPQACYMAHPDNGLYVSKNACATLSYVYHAGISSLAFVPKSKTIFAITQPDAANAAVSASTNGGTTWSPTGWKFTYPYQVVVSPATANDVLVASGVPWGPPQIAYSHDGGKTFHASAGLPARLASAVLGLDYPVHRLYAVFDPSLPTTVLLIDHDPVTNNVLIYRSIDTGQTFTHTSTLVQPVSSRPWPNLIVPNRGEHPVPEIPYYATRFFGNRMKFNPNAPPHAVPVVILTTRFGAYASTDVGSTWTRIDSTTVAHDFIGLAWDNGYVYLASFGQGILKSDAPLQ